MNSFLKTLAIVLLLVGSSTFTAKAQVWLPVGPSDSDQNNETLTTTQITADNQIYIATETGPGSNAVFQVKKVLSPAGLQDIGPAVTGAAGELSSFVVSPGGVVYWVKRKTIVPGTQRLYISRLDGSSWSLVDSTLSSGYIFHAPSDTLYAMIPRDAANGNRIVVKKWTGSSWDMVGGMPASAGTAALLYTRFTPSGLLGIAYQDSTNANAITIRRFDGSNWNTVLTTPNIIPNYAQSWAIAPDTACLPVLVQEVGNYTVLKRHTGTGWKQIDSANRGTPDEHRLVVNKYNDVYLQLFNSTSTQIWPNFLALYRDTVQCGIWYTPNGRISNLLCDTAGRLVVSYLQHSNFDRISIGVCDTAVWKNVAFPTVSGALDGRLALNTSKQPFALFEGTRRFHPIAGYYGQLSVKKYSNGGWQYLGQPVLDEATFEPSGFSGAIAAGRGDSVWVAYPKDADNGKLKVLRYDGSAWVPVADPGSFGKALFVSIKLQHDSVPVVAYCDQGNGNKVYVRAYNGTAWADLSGAAVSVAGASGLALDCDAQGNPYVSYIDSSSNLVVCKKFSSGTWNDVFPATNLNAMSFRVDGNGVPYYFGNSTDIRKYEQNAWVLIPAPETQVTALTFDSSNTPYIAINAATNIGINYNRLVRVRKFNGSSWVQATPGPLSITTASSFATLPTLVSRGNVLYLGHYTELCGLFVKRLNTACSANMAINDQPTPQRACYGDTVRFSVSPVNADSVSWVSAPSAAGPWAPVVNGNNYTGADSTTLTVYTAGLSDTAVHYYRAVLLNECSAKQSDSVSLSFVSLPPAIPVVELTAAPDGAANGQTVNFSVTTTNWQLATTPTYAWYLNGSLLSGQTTNGYASSTLAPGDQIWVLVSARDSCGNQHIYSSDTVTMQQPSAAVHVAGPTQQLLLYPNPNHGQVDIQLQDPVLRPGDGWTMVVTDAVGRVIWEAEGTLGAATLRKKIVLPAGTPGGLYLLKLMLDDGRQYVQSFSVQAAR